MSIFIIGLGYVGLPIALQLCKIGHKVIGFDTNFDKIKELNNGFSEVPEISSSEIIRLIQNGDLKFVNELPKSITESIYIIAVPTPLDDNLKPDTSFLESACDFISESVCENSLIISESTSYIGTLRNLIKPRIDLKSGLSYLKYAVAPERIDPGNNQWDISNTPRVISGLTINATKQAVDFYKKFCNEIVTVSSPEVAEASKLLENTFRQVNIALINEFSDITNGFSISTSEVITAAATKPFGFMAFNPGVGVGGHCIPIDPAYLTYSAKLVGVESKVIETANLVNLTRYKVIASRIENAYGSSLKGTKIQIAGVAYKLGVSDIRESPAIKLIHELRGRGALVSWHDPLVNSFELESSIPISSEIDLGLVIVPHNQIDLRIWKTSGIKVFDLSSTLKNFGWPKFI